jgi:hypothetical protein
MVQPDIKNNIGKFIEIIQGLDSALNESFAEAASLMRKLGRESHPSKAEYLRWPLFEEVQEDTRVLVRVSGRFWRCNPGGSRSQNAAEVGGELT